MPSPPAAIALPPRTRWPSVSPVAALAPCVLALAACTGGGRPAVVTGPAQGTASAHAAPAPGVAGGPAALTPAAVACANAPLLAPGSTVRGTTSRNADLFHASCAYGAASPDTVYRLHVEQPSRVAVRVAGGYDTVVHLRASCEDDASEVACNDDTLDTRHSAFDADLSPGDYYVVVDGYGGDNAGFYALTVTSTPSPAAQTRPSIARTRPGEGAVVRHEPGAGPPSVRGDVLFAKRGFTPHGLTRATQDMPAPRFVVEAVDPRGAVVASGETDEHGRFTLPVATGSTVRVRAVTRTTLLGNDIRVVTDPGSELPFEVSTQPFRVEGDERVALRADVGGVEPAGAFNILAQFVRYLPFATRAFGHPLPPLYAFWRRGNNRALPQGSITAFLMDYRRHDGTFALQIQGGEEGREDGSDSDQFDDPVILHEFSHFVVHTMAGHYSIGGLHRNGELHFPAQALDEGAASALACAIAGDGHYWDSAGLEPTGTILVDEDSERLALPDRGIGSQNSAQALVWDLIDGAEGIPDQDHDGVAVGISGMLRVYSSFHDDPVAFPAIHTVLERAVSLGMLTGEQASRLVHAPVDHGFAFPLPAREQWPSDLAIPSEARGSIDGQTQPAPSGGRNIPSNGLDAIHTYRLQVPRRGLVYVDLAIQGPGTQASGTDLDLQLLTRQLQPIAQSTGEGPTEAIHRILDAGTYIVLVRDGDTSLANERVGTDGNRAAYTLRVRMGG